MAMHEQTPDQTTPTRPTPERATEAQAYFARPEIVDIARNAIRHELGEKGVRHFETILAVAKPPSLKELAELLAKHWHGEFCETFDVEYAQFRMTHGDRFDVAENVKFVVSRLFGLVKP